MVIASSFILPFVDSCSPFCPLLSILFSSPLLFRLILFIFSYSPRVLLYLAPNVNYMNVLRGLENNLQGLSQEMRKKFLGVRAAMNDGIGELRGIFVEELLRHQP